MWHAILFSFFSALQYAVMTIGKHYAEDHAHNSETNKMGCTPIDISRVFGPHPAVEAQLAEVWEALAQPLLFGVVGCLRFPSQIQNSNCSPAWSAVFVFPANVSSSMTARHDSTTTAINFSENYAAEAAWSYTSVQLISVHELTSVACAAFPE